MIGCMCGSLCEAIIIYSAAPEIGCILSTGWLYLAVCVAHFIIHSVAQEIIDKYGQIYWPYCGLVRHCMPYEK